MHVVMGKGYLEILKQCIPVTRSSLRFTTTSCIDAAVTNIRMQRSVSKKSSFQYNPVL